MAGRSRQPVDGHIGNARLVSHPLQQHGPKMAFMQHDQPVQTLTTNRADKPLAERIGVSSQLHRQRAVRHKPFGLSTFHPLRGRTFQLVDCRQTWGEDRVYFHDDSGQLTRLPRQWTDVVPDDPTVVVSAGWVHFRYHDLCRLADLLRRLDAPLLGERADQEC
jgi:hypothetical protein